MTVDELAALLRVNRKSVYEAIARGEIPGIRRIGRTVRASREAVLAWLREGRVSRSRGK
jgi:excisionase family DNA binding protein